MTKYGAAQLTSAKFFGVAGMDSLRAMLQHANHYGLKFILCTTRSTSRCWSSAAGGRWRVTTRARLRCGQKMTRHPRAKCRRMRCPLRGKACSGDSADWQQLSGNSVCDVAAGAAAGPGSGHVASEAPQGAYTPEAGAHEMGIGSSITALTAFLVGIAWVQSGGLQQHAMCSAGTPEEAVQALMSEIQARDYPRAYSALDPTSGTDYSSFVRDVAGSDGSLRTYSSLQSADVSPLHADSDQALVRLRMNWSSAVGSLDDVRELARAPRRLGLACGVAKAGVSDCAHRKSCR